MKWMIRTTLLLVGTFMLLIVLTDVDGSETLNNDLWATVLYPTKSWLDSQTVEWDSSIQLVHAETGTQIEIADNIITRERYPYPFRWSADGHWLFYVGSSYGHDGQIYRLHISGRDHEQFWDSPATIGSVYNAVLSPNGLYQAWLDDPYETLYVSKYDGSSVRPIASLPQVVTFGGSSYQPSIYWSVDSRWIIFANHVYQTTPQGTEIPFEIYRINPETGEVEQLLSLHDVYRQTIFVGKAWIYFVLSDDQTEVTTLYRMSLNGTQLQPMFDLPTDEYFRKLWMPSASDMAAIVGIRADTDHNRYFFRHINLDTGTSRPLILETGVDSLFAYKLPSWSAHGNYMTAIVQSAYENYWVITNADGSHQ